MTPAEATKLTRENRHKQDEEYILNKILEKVFAKIKEAAANGENRVKNFLPYGTDTKYQHKGVEYLKGMGYSFFDGEEEGSYGESYKIDNNIIYWKI